MKTPLSPSDIELLIWCHCRPEPHDRIDAPAIVDGIHMWLEAGMIEPNPDFANGTYTTTDKGRAMIEALCNTPEPRCAWIDASGNPLLIVKRSGVQAIADWCNGDVK